MSTFSLTLYCLDVLYLSVTKMQWQWNLLKIGLTDKVQKLCTKKMDFHF